MGNKASRERWVRDEFKHLIEEKKSKNIRPTKYVYKAEGSEPKEFLNLSDIQIFKQPRNRDIQLDASHLGTLFVLDRSKDGRFYLDELIDFTNMYMDRQAINANTVDVPKEFQGLCSLKLWNFVSQPRGKSKFARWVGRLFSHGHTLTLRKHRHEVFVRRSAIPALDEILAISKSYGVDQGKIFYLIHRTAIEKGMIDEDDRSVRDVFPRRMLEYFGEKFINGFVNYMKELGFEPNMDVS